MQPFAMDTRPPADEIKVSPSASEHLRASKPSALHEEDCWPLPPDRSPTNVLLGTVPVESKSTR